MKLNSLGFRLLIGYATPLVLFLAAALVAYITIQRLLTAMEYEERSEEIIAKTHEFQEGVAAMAAAKRAHHLLGESQYLAEFKKKHEGVLSDLTSLQELTAGNPDQHAAVNELMLLLDHWQKLARQDFDKFAKPIKGDLSKIFSQLQLKEAIKVLQEMQEHSGNLLASEQDQLAQRRRVVQATTTESIWLIIGASSLAVVLSLVVTLWITRRVTKPIERLVNAAGKLRRGQYSIVTPSGPNEIVELTRSFNVAGIALVERTVTLESRELRYRTIVRTTSDILWTTDQNGKNREMSTWCAYTGQEEPDLNEDNNWAEAIHPDDRDGFLRHWTEAVKQKRMVEEEIRVRRADGKYRHFNCRSVPIIDEQDEVHEWVRICTDLTDKKEEEQARRDVEAAEASSRAKSEFLAKMSHELRTPLNAIIGMSKMLLTHRFGALNDKQQDYLNDVTQAGEHLLNLINDILDLSKVEAGRMELALEAFPVGETISAVLSTVKTLAEEKQLRLEKVLPEPDGTMMADSGRFRQILFNLLSNAVKFTPSGGTVTVRCHWVDGVSADASATTREQATGVRIEVEDTGIGIDLEDQEKIGTEFYQVNANEESNQGTGLGLALTRKLVQLLDGRFWFHSTPGEGSRFSAVFPLPIEAGGPQPSEPTECKPCSGDSTSEKNKSRVLIVDDHEPTTKLLADWLAEAGVEVQSAYDGRSGLDLAGDYRPHLILLDIGLPDMNGWQVLSELKSEPGTAGIPVVVISAQDHSDIPQQLNILEWFVKPLEKDHLLTRLRHICPAALARNDILTALVVDDDDSMRKLLSDLILSEEIRVIQAKNGQEALDRLNEFGADFVLLDLFMPRLDGFEVVRTIRGDSQWSQLPIIILTAKDITSEDKGQLEGQIQSIITKSALTRERLLNHLGSLGFILPPSATLDAPSSGNSHE